MDDGRLDSPGFVEHTPQRRRLRSCEDFMIPGLVGLVIVLSMVFFYGVLPVFSGTSALINRRTPYYSRLSHDSDRHGDLYCVWCLFAAVAPTPGASCSGCCDIHATETYCRGWQRRQDIPGASSNDVDLFHRSHITGLYAETASFKRKSVPTCHETGRYFNNDDIDVATALAILA